MNILSSLGASTDILLDILKDSSRTTGKGETLALKDNQILEARVLKVLSQTQAMLLIDGKKLTATTRMPLSENETLTLKVTRSEGNQVLKIVGPPLTAPANEALSEMRRLGQQGPYGKLSDVLNQPPSDFIPEPTVPSPSDTAVKTPSLPPAPFQRTGSGQGHIPGPANDPIQAFVSDTRMPQAHKLALLASDRPQGLPPELERNLSDLVRRVSEVMTRDSGQKVMNPNAAGTIPREKLLEALPPEQKQLALQFLDSPGLSFEGKLNRLLSVTNMESIQNVLDRVKPPSGETAAVTGGNVAGTAIDTVKAPQGIVSTLPEGPSESQVALAQNSPKVPVAPPSTPETAPGVKVPDTPAHAGPDRNLGLTSRTATAAAEDAAGSKPGDFPGKPEPLPGRPSPSEPAFQEKAPYAQPSPDLASKKTMGGPSPLSPSALAGADPDASSGPGHPLLSNGRPDTPGTTFREPRQPAPLADKAPGYPSPAPETAAAQEKQAPPRVMVSLTDSKGTGDGKAEPLPTPGTVRSSLENLFSRLETDALKQAGLPGRDPSTGVGLIKKIKDLVDSFTLSPDRDYSGTTVKNLVRDSGLMWENKLRNLVAGQSDKSPALTRETVDRLIENDIKALSMKGGDLPETTRHTVSETLKSFSESLEKMQLLNSQTADDSGKYLLPLPYVHEGTLRFGQLFIDLDRKKEARDDNSDRIIRVAFLLSMSRLGPVQAGVSIYKKSITGEFLVGSQEVKTLMDETLPDLASDLAAKGYAVRKLECRITDPATLSNASLVEKMTGTSEGGLNIRI